MEFLYFFQDVNQWQGYECNSEKILQGCSFPVSHPSK